MAGNPDTPPTEAAAVQAARQHLEAQGMGPALAGRRTTVQRQGPQTIVRFSPPPGTLGGDFTLTLDAGLQVVAQTFQR